MWIISNEGLIWTYNNYSILITALPVVIIFILKLVAIINPRVHTDKIIDLVKEYWPVATKVDK